MHRRHQLSPRNLSSALETLDAAYLPLVLQEAAGLPLDPSFAEQKNIMLRCNGAFYACKKGAEARRFNRLLIDAGMIKGLYISRRSHCRACASSRGREATKQSI